MNPTARERQPSPGFLAWLRPQHKFNIATLINAGNHIIRIQSREIFKMKSLAGRAVTSAKVAEDNP